MIVIDGSMGEGGGQVLRSALGLAALSGRPLRVENIRAGRRKPGLMRQHLTAVQAVAAVCAGTARGAEVRSQAVELEPGPLRAGEYTFSVGTAGSAVLILQTVLPLLLHAEGRSSLTIEGGTHNPMAPPFDFVEHTWAPVMREMGAELRLELLRPGFYPAGGGALRAEVVGRAGGLDAPVLRTLTLDERPEQVSRRARIWSSALPGHIAEREGAVIRERLGWADGEIETVTVAHPRGPGNVVILEAGYGVVTESFSAFGAPDRRAEAVALDAVKGYQRHRVSRAVVGEHLADQLVIPCVLAGGGRFTALSLSRHSRTQLELVRRFVDCHAEVETVDRDCVRVTITR